MLEHTRHCIIYLHFNHQKVEELKWLYTPGPRRFGQWVGLAPPFFVPAPPTYHRPWHRPISSLPHTLPQSLEAIRIGWDEDELFCPGEGSHQKGLF